MQVIFSFAMLSWSECASPRAGVLMFVHPAPLTMVGSRVHEDDAKDGSCVSPSCANK